MTYDLLIGLALFAFASSITPGPNNLMLMASGANFGVLRSIPHMLGVALGFVFMVILVGLGLAGVFDRFPISHTILKVASVVYLLYLAWKIATAAPKIDGAEASGTPMTFLQAAAFQWVNPKAWSMALTAVTVYTAPGADVIRVILVAVVFGVINHPSVSVWTAAGLAVRRWLGTPRRMRAFNITMGVLLVLSLYPLLLP